MRKTGFSKDKRIIWVHNFPNKVASGGGWMYNQYEFLENEVDMYYLDNLRSPFRFIQHILKLRKISAQYEVAHAQYGSAVGFITSFMHCRRILSLKGSDWYQSPPTSWFDRIRIYIGGLFTRISIPRFHQIVVMSEAMKNDLKEQFPKSEVITITDPIDLDRFKPKKGRKNSGSKRILFASINIENPIKRFSLAQQAFQILKAKIPEAEFIIMTKIPHDQVVDFMNSVDVLLLTSIYEGWPNVVKEILACNRPFVSTDVSDLRQIAERSQSCFVCENTPEALCEGLIKALNAPEENLRRFVAPFNMHDTLQSLRALYK